MNKRKKSQKRKNGIDTVSKLVFWSRLATKLGPWHKVYIIRQ